ncbi:cellulase family glycosylhydrolase [Nocardioides marmotae]|uniref:cellulase family glycosylhydrolase n=1 Tax=Nocardioides marmotae TaxID=2663857 RepID=UPI0012B5253F|nr:cellulase family glycosylhydrolase [Nocardioides marmotae]MBC9733456.1 cellulase family glycosylhydrolase [Nocardioides marmotae]MTB84563.1 cellulase family glycosylhydrolase [Nocardioides marmotae]
MSLPPPLPSPVPASPRSRAEAPAQAHRSATLVAGLTGLLALALLMITLDAPRAAGAPDVPTGTAAAATTADQATGPAPRRRADGCLNKRGVPACSAFVGAAHGSNSEPTDLEALAGRPLGIRRTYWTSKNVDKAIQTATSDVSKGRLPWISFKLPKGWDRMALGEGDSWTRQIANRLDQIPGPVWLAFHHEPEGDGNLTQWRKMQERLAPLVRRAADNVAYTVILTGYDQLYGAASYSLDRIWPRKVKIDVAGFDVYNNYGVVKNGRKNTKWPNIEKDYFQPFSSWAKTSNVAWGLAETGLTNEAADKYPGWMGDTYRALKQNNGVAFTYFDTELNAYGSWPLTTAVKRNAFRDILQGSPRIDR